MFEWRCIICCINFIHIVSTSGLLWWFDEANQVKKFKTMWSYVECMKISWRLKSLV